MKLQYIYRADINRDINGVIKVAQNDERSIEQELREYIITRELRRHFNTFLNNYEKSLNTPTDKIGVWISGFFGSGKSHFLKILSWLLSNDVVAGKHAVDYFMDKFDDPMMFAQLERCAKAPTETILFNIDSKSPIKKDKTAILRVFAKVFYEHRGFYGDDLKVARLEQFIDRSGRMAAFKAKFEEIHGDSWENSRDAFSFFEDDVVGAMTATLDMSETAARNWFNGTETADLSIEQLVREIREYIDSKGRDFRLLFMIDEVGQYIGSDGSLMLNLQTIVEEIGSRCDGRVWVMVTSQEAIDSITKISGDDFSKIQGRFNTRLSLSSSSVDEVIKKRILAKTDNAANMLALSYGKNSSILKSLLYFDPQNAVQDLKGYGSEYEFIETYPFVPYQFRLMQNVLVQIRKHGNSGKHLSGGERSMLSGFQEAAQAIENKDENALVPFSLFYNTVHTFLESAIRRVIDRCQTAADNHDGIEQYDVSILKLLYLIRYVDDLRANVDNIAILMVDDIRADKINMRKAIQESLDRLVRENYVARHGETYTFLTDDEQDIERDIRNTPVDSAAIVQSIAQIVFGDLYVSKKFKYGKCDFPYDQIIECRRRVKEQLRKMTPSEFSDVELGYIDNETGEERIVELPEVSSGTLVFQGFEKPGYVYGVGRSVSNLLGIYRLENKLVGGTGTFSFKNVEGLAHSHKGVRDSLTAAFNYFGENARGLVADSYADYDYSLYFNDLQNRGVSDEISVAEVVGLYSGLANKPVLPALVICGRVVMSGSMMPITTELDEIFVTAANAGAKKIMLPEESRSKYAKLRDDLKEEIEVIFYSSPMEAAKKALGAVDSR